MKKAAKEAKEIIENANAAAEKTKAQAYDKGYSKGTEKGLADGKAYVSEIVKSFSSLMNELASYKIELLNEAEGQILKLVAEALNKIILTKLDEDDEIIVRVVREALKNLTEREVITIKVNPEDAAVMKKEKVSLVQELDGIKKLTIIEDESIQRGGCFIETVSSDVDARIDKQIGVVRKALES